MIGRERASRVGVAGIAGYRHGLAAAAAEIDLAESTRAAGLLHPRSAAEGVEGVRVEPDVEQRPILHIVEFEMLDGFRGVAGEHLAGRRDVYEAFAPPTHARLRPLGVVVG